MIGCSPSTTAPILRSTATNSARGSPFSSPWDKEETHFTAIRETTDATLINAANGVIQVPFDPTVEISLLPHSPDYYFKTKIATSYEPAAECPVYLAALRRAFPDLEDVRSFGLHCGYVFIPN